MIEEKTNICCLNAPKSVVDYLREMHDVYDGNLGARVDLSKAKGYSHYIVPNPDFPDNDLDYDIFVVDLKYATPIPYKEEEHRHKYVIGQENICFFCQPPQTMYDLMPYGAYLLNKSLDSRKERVNEGKRKVPLVIIFQEERLSSEYHMVNKITDSSFQDRGSITMSNYGFAESLPFAKAQVGNRVELIKDELSKCLFRNLEDKIFYHQIFRHPKVYDPQKEEFVESSELRPMLTNNSGDIVSFIYGSKDTLYFILPQADDETKKEIIARLFEQVLYEYFDEYFPVVKNAKWISEAMRALPEMWEIELEEEKLNSVYAANQERLAKRKEDVLEYHEFLRKLITASGGELVQAMIQYLEWIGFDNVIDKDKYREGKFEEDIQVDMGERGLIVMEVKGINGTSKDSECSQIDKIRDKRKNQDENKGREVYALYVVNHQRRKAPSERLLVPFDNDQINGAISAERGMMSTWQLFNIACAVESGVISKEQVRRDMLHYGAIAFQPDLVQSLNSPIQDWGKGTIIGVNVNTLVSVGDTIYVEKDFQWYKAEVVSLRQGDLDQQNVVSGEAGIGLSQRLPKGKCKWYVKHNI